jgi:L-lactate dehydrogenase complex protein LldG
MSAREAILANVHANQPSGTYPLPDLPSFHLEGTSDVVGLFLRNLEGMGGRYHTGDVRSCIDQLFPNAKVIASTVPDFAGNRQVFANVHPRNLADIDVAVTRASFGVAETGSILLVDQTLIANAVAYLAQHLVVLLDPAAIVPMIQDAYCRSEFHRHRYASFHSGPSATADIEGVLIHGAQGVRSLTVVLA